MTVFGFDLLRMTPENNNNRKVAGKDKITGEMIKGGGIRVVD